jgi:peroxiredoxin
MGSIVLKLVLILVAAVPIAPAEDALEVLQKTAAVYKSAKSYALTGVDKLEESGRGRQRTITRNFRAWRLGKSMRVDFADGAVRLTDGRTEWNSPAQGKPFSKRTAPWDSRGLRAFQEYYYDFEGIAEFVKTAAFITPPGKDGFLIEVTYELPGRVAAEVIKSYWIDAGNYTVLRETSNPQVMSDRPVNVLKLSRTVTLSKTELNIPLEESRFSPPSETPRAGLAAPDFALPDLAGTSVSIKDLRGKTVVLYFWATWCGTCRAEMPKLEKLAHEYADRGLVLLGVNDEDPQTAAAYLKENGHTLRSLVDRWRDVYKRYDVNEIPSMILVGPDGRIAGGFGYRETEALESALKTAGLR